MHAITNIRRQRRYVNPKPDTLKWMKRTAHRVFRRRTQTRFATQLRGRREAVMEVWYGLVVDEKPVLTTMDF